MHEWFFTFGVVLSAGLCGAGFLGPFIAGRKLVLLASPLVGILLVVLGANACYALLEVPYKTAGMLSAAACLAAGAIAWRSFTDWRRLALLAILAAATGGLAVWTVDRATLRCGGPAIVFMDGTDHAGYAQMADWFNNHSVTQVPVADPGIPYESWPEILFRFDPRFGSFGLLAIISDLYGSSGIFSYDVACAVVLTAACLSVAAIYAPSALWMAALIFGLFISNLYDYAHCGYLGKLIAYPSALLLAGLVLDSLEFPTLEQMFVLALLASAVGLMHSGAATAVLIAPILAMAFIPLAMRSSDRAILRRTVLMCAITLLLPVVASGVPARFVSSHYPNWDVSWSYEFPRLLDLENQGVWLSRCGPSTLRWMMWAAAGSWAAALAGAVAWRSPRAVGLLAGPAVLLGAMTIFHNRAGAFQLLGFIYPATLCGMVALFAQMPSVAGRIAVIAVAALAIGLRMPRFLGSVSRYASHPPPAYVFTESETKKLAAAIGSKSVQVDVSDTHDGLLLLAELGSRHLNVHWSGRAWQFVVGYRQWPWTEAPTALLLKMAPDPQPWRHFDLVGVTDGRKD